MRVAVLDDYQQVAADMADWSVLTPALEVQIFQDHVFEEDALVQRLKDFDIVMGMRERTPFRRSLLERLPRLKLLMTAAMGNASFDVDAATELGIVVGGTEGDASATTAELTGGLYSRSRGISSSKTEVFVRDGGGTPLD